MEKIKNYWIDEQGYHCFGCDPNHASGLKMEFYEDGDEVVCFWEPTGEHQGWVNVLHGGIQATLIDEICGWVVFHKFQSSAVTSKMEVKYRKPVKTNEGKLTIRARAVDHRRNLVTINAQIFNAAGELCTEGCCIYFMLAKM